MWNKGSNAKGQGAGAPRGTLTPQEQVELKSASRAGTVHFPGTSASGVNAVIASEVGLIRRHMSQSLYLAAMAATQVVAKGYEQLGDAQRARSAWKKSAKLAEKEARRLMRLESAHPDNAYELQCGPVEQGLCLGTFAAESWEKTGNVRAATKGWMASAALYTRAARHKVEDENKAISRSYFQRALDAYNRAYAICDRPGITLRIARLRSELVAEAAKHGYALDQAPA